VEELQSLRKALESLESTSAQDKHRAEHMQSELLERLARSECLQENAVRDSQAYRSEFGASAEEVESLREALASEQATIRALRCAEQAESHRAQCEERTSKKATEEMLTLRSMLQEKSCQVKALLSDANSRSAIRTIHSRGVFCFIHSEHITR
jgi:hypothetical protein